MSRWLHRLCAPGEEMRRGSLFTSAFFFFFNCTCVPDGKGERSIRAVKRTKLSKRTKGVQKLETKEEGGHGIIEYNFMPLNIDDMRSQFLQIHLKQLQSD